MSDFILSCCSTADLSAEHLSKRGIEYTCFHFTLDGVLYEDDLGKSISYDKFYEMIKNGSDAKTSQINIEQFTEHFTSLLSRGKDVLHVTLSSGLSGTYRSAMNAAEIVREKFPDRKLYVVDSLAASSGYGLIMETLADMRDEGKSIDEIYEWIEQHKLEMHHWFFSTDLSQYIKGGRISKTQGMIGGMLGICPLLNMDNNGKLVSRAKVRTKKRVIREMVNKMHEHAKDGDNYSGKCFISHSACSDDAKEVASLVEAEFPKLYGRVQINNIGTTIGSHTGTGTVALFFWGTPRID